MKKDNQKYVCKCKKSLIWTTSKQCSMGLARCNFGNQMVTFLNWRPNPKYFVSCFTAPDPAFISYLMSLPKVPITLMAVFFIPVIYISIKIDWFNSLLYSFLFIRNQNKYLISLKKSCIATKRRWVRPVATVIQFF